MAEPGDQFDVWEVECALGTGGMGSVYRCHNVQAPRILAAIKVLEASLRTSQDANRRFVREAEILHRLDHPNVVQVRNVRIDHDPPYLEMEFVEGVSLEARMQQGPIPLGDALDLMAQVVEALAYIHDQNVRHRDIKPANFVVTGEGRLKLVDFGLAVETDLSRITQAGVAFGTVAYAPPEWIDPASVDPVQWDLYAAGVVFYEMLTGHFAFPTSGEGSPKQQALQVILGKQHAPPLDIGDAFPGELRALIRDLTQARAERRPQSAHTVRDRLERARLQHEGKAPPSTRSLAADIPTEVPPVGRRPAPPAAARRSAYFDNSPQWRLVGGMVGAALGAMLLGIGLALLRSPDALSDDAPTRDVVIGLLGVPDDYPITLLVEGRGPAQHAEGWLFEGLPVGARLMSWVGGKDCGADACMDGACPVWCGTGLIPVTIEEGEGEQRVEVPMILPEPSVVVTVPSVLDARSGGLFKRKPNVHLSATLDGRLGGIVDDHRVAWRNVPPGQRELVVSVGQCAPEALGCWPERACPAGCSSTVRTLLVPWGERDVRITVDLPTPK